MPATPEQVLVVAGIGQKQGGAGHDPQGQQGDHRRQAGAGGQALAPPVQGPPGHQADAGEEQCQPGEEHRPVDHRHVVAEHRPVLAGQARQQQGADPGHRQRPAAPGQPPAAGWQGQGPPHRGEGQEPDGHGQVYVHDQRPGEEVGREAVGHQRRAADHQQQGEDGRDGERAQRQAQPGQGQAPAHADGTGQFGPWLHLHGPLMRHLADEGYAVEGEKAEHEHGDDEPRAAHR